ncbi:hypothetical protein LshimejAT787_0106320 [Lyophyllum shimeji]|uniref:BTB domain-containing protein n=1 Tax=Lyophyllum shimeji TaxID=47721 RepID=A0A9P3PDC7_LYOSH|nr:hypothetical protein LshimejAT787_0106320 [Lyophyllum shimeji]
MDHADWDNVLQYVADPLDLSAAFPDKRNDRSELANLNAQVPTPPLSNDGSPVQDDPSEPGTLVSVSTTFYPGSNLQPVEPDVVLLSSDSVFFYVHSHLLLGASDNGFHSLLPPPPASKGEDSILNVPETSTVLNIILHTIYDMSCAHYTPSFSHLCTAVRRLSFYGIHPESRILPAAPLYTVLLSQAPLYPLELYTLAAAFNLYDLAVSTSSHLLSFPLSSLTDEMAEAMGPVYLKRLFFLHFGRSDALKRVLLSPPHPHPPTQWCDFADQKKLTRAWALASAYLAWDARPDLSTSTMESALRPLEEHLGCDDCKQALRDRIKTLVIQWSIVKRTI